MQKIYNWLLLFTLALLGGQVSAQASSNRPNFLMIVADDLGYSDIGAFGGEIETPNLNALAARGLQLSNLHAAPTCSPTRAMLLTGLDNHEAGLGSMAELLTANQRGHAGYEGYLRPDAVTLAELLSSAGYRTLFSGKWHLGLAPEHDPSHRGFQQSFSLLQGGHNHFGLDLSSDPTKGWTYRENGKLLASLPADFYSSDYFATKLIDQLRTTRRESNGQKPFFAYLAFTAPHWPLQAPPGTIAKYKGRYEAGYEVLRRRRLERQIELGLLAPDVVAHEFDIAKPWNSLTAEQKARESRRMEVYAAMVDRLDQNVGRVIQALKDTGELDNTVILFLSDNGAEGMALEQGILPLSSPTMRQYQAADNRIENIGTATSFESIGPGWGEATSAPSWRFKTFQTEGGTRVPAFLVGPGIRQGTAAAFVSVMDVVPTFLDLAGMVRPQGGFAGRAVKPIRGQSWVDWLRRRTQHIYASDKPVGSELFGGRALRQGEWKLLDVGDGQWRLFNIASDPGETRDLSASEPRRKAALLKAWEDYAGEVGVVLPDGPQRIVNRPSAR